jgi:hypothetical protein
MAGVCIYVYVYYYVYKTTEYLYNDIKCFEDNHYYTDMKVHCLLDIQDVD